MKAAHPTSSETKAITTASHLRATAAVGGALIGYLVAKTPSARLHLFRLAEAAKRTGNLTDTDADVVHQVLAQPLTPTTTATLYTLN